MKIAGYILSIIGGIAFIGAASAGHSVFGPLFWIVVGFVLIFMGGKKEKAQTEKENDRVHTSEESSSAKVSNYQTIGVTEETKTTQEETKVETKPYWEIFSLDNPEKALQLSSLYKTDLSLLSDKDIRERINTIDRLCDLHKCSISQLKSRCIRDMEQFPLSFFDQLIELTEKEKDKEAANFHISKDNTACALLVDWMKERKIFLEKNNVYNKPIEDNSENQLSPEESFKKRYSEILVKQIENNANIPLFSEGYDSPIAHEIMDVMYAFLKDKTEIEKANKLGYGKRYIFIITEETEKVVKKYCHAALQECIEYYKFPNKKVVTSFRCPHCGSWKVWNEDYGFECGECGCTWHAPLGYNLYLDNNNY